MWQETGGEGSLGSIYNFLYEYLFYLHTYIFTYACMYSMITFIIISNYIQCEELLVRATNLTHAKITENSTRSCASGKFPS